MHREAMGPAAVAVFLLSCVMQLVAVQSQLSVGVLPDALFVDSGGVHDIVETAFIRLVCTASSGSAPDVEWQRNSVALTSDIPSRWIRTSTSGSITSSVLNIASFQSADDGTYRCVATDGGSSMNSGTVTLTAVSSTPTGTVTVVTFPEDTDPVFRFDNRVPVDLTGTFTSECVGGHIGETDGDNSGLPAPPNVVWVRDGVALADGGRITIVDSDQFGTPPSRKRSVLTITNFMQSDAGIYQCIFTDVDTAGEVIATTPLQVDTGATPSVQRLSPANIVLVPPEKLVIEVETSGAYATILWDKNAIPAGGTGFEVGLANFVNFFEIFVREPTTTSDIGLYEIDLGVRPGQTEPQAVEITVTPYVSPATTATGSSPVTLMEGQDVDISCTSSGNPIPDITWELDGISAPFDQSDSSNPLQATLDEITVEFQFTVGQRMSTLQIRSAVYPDHDGVYTCTGANSQATESGSDSATITVVVQAIPEVDVVAPQTRVSPGGSVILTCNVTKANPAVSTFSWTFTPSGGSIMTLSGETSNTLTLTDFAADDVGEYTCTAMNSVGTGSDSIIIEEGVLPDVTVNPLDPVVLGTTASLTCSATGDPPITYEWRMQGDPTVLNSNTATGDFDLTLADSSDYGTYTCTARNNFGTDSGSVVVEQALPPVTPANQTVDVIVGDSLTLMVTITNFNLPITSITWRLGDMELTSATENVTVTSSGDLTQPPVTSTLVVDPVLSLVSQGTYTVTVTNPAGTAVTGFDVTILAPATIRDPPGPTSVTEDEGQPVAFSCTASGSPAPSIQWFRGSSQLMNMDMMNRVTISDSLVELSDFFYTTSNLTIDPVERADADVYQCVAAVNRMEVNATDQEDFTLTVNFAPDITSALVDANAEYRETVTLSCSAVGLPEPTFTWFMQPYGDAQTQLSDDGVNILISTAADPQVVFTVTSNLTLVSVEPSDTANYTCIATNNLNTATDTAAVTVLAGAEITFPLGAASAEVNRTESVNLTCTARGSPAPVFMWYYEDTLLMESSEGISLTTLPTSGMSPDFIFVTSILTVESTEPEDGGTYVCVASNTVYGREVNDSQVYTLQVNFPINITDSPMSVDVLSPQPAVLNCTTRGVPIPDFVWIKEFFNGTTVEFTESTGNIDISRFYSGAVTVSTLTIDPTDPSDTALYTCFAENLLIRGSPEESDTAQVRVFVAPTILVPEDNSVFFVNETDSISIQCNASGLPVPSLRFLNMSGLEIETTVGSGSGSGMQPDTNEMLRDDGTYGVSLTLTIVDAMDEDSDTYSCQAFRLIPELDMTVPFTDTNNFEVVVQIAPVITDPPVNAMTVSPNEATFTCQATGVLLPDIEWWRREPNGDLTLLSSDSKTTISTNETLNARTVQSNLTILNTVPSDATDYICVATNDAGSDRASANLTVYVTPHITFPMDGEVIMVNEFNPVTFTCNATGIPPPEINWYRNGTLLNNAYDPRITLSEHTDPEPFSTPGGNIYLVSRTLTFDNTMDEDSGTYTCVASNGFMPADRQDFELVVYVAPNITEPPMDQLVVQPENATFSCQATGRPRPRIDWARVNESSDDPIDLSQEENEIVIENQPMGEREILSMLTIVETQPSDAGQYVCGAISEIGGLDPDFAQANLTVYVTPMITFPRDGQAYTVNEFNPVTFTCNATGIPPPEINWYRNGTLLNNTYDQRITLSERTDPEPFSTPGGYIYLVSRTLTLDNTMDEDSGTYTCVASNGVMPEDRQDFELVVYVAPTILVPPMDLVVVQPENATFSCRATGRPRPRIDWARVNESSDDPIDLSQGENEIVIENQPMGEREILSTLTIVETQPSDAGQYVCGAISEVEGLDPDFVQANLTVHVIPNIIFPMEGEVITINEFNPVTFTCNATGIPPPEINWYRNGTLLNNTYDPRITLSEHTDPEPFSTPGGNIYLVSRTLTLDNTMDEDSGTYTCVASNGNRVMPEDRQDFELIVYVAPTITEPPVDLVVVQPENATFSCQATGRPRPRIDWARVNESSDDPIDLSQEENEIVIENQPMGEREILSTLTIVETQPSDAGQYVCGAISEVEGLDPDFAQANLTVHVIPNITFPMDGMNYTVNEFNPVTFTCNATGIPPPEINWYRNGTLLNNANDPRITLSERTDPEPLSTPGGNIYLVSRTLTLDNTMDEDSGTYTCVAYNGNRVMPEDRQDFELIVYVAPTITEPPVDLVVVQPENATFSCQATGRPRPDISWFRQEGDIRGAEIANGVDILIEEQPTGEREIMSNLTIVETQPSDAGQYVCVATSDVEGLDPADALTNLTVHVIPNITFVVDGQAYTVNEFNPVTFTCNATGIPPPEINWYRNGTQLNNANDPRITLSERTDPEPFSTPGGNIYLVSRTLTLDNTMDEDSGTYTCVASNGNSVMPEDRQDFELVVYVAPNITEPPMDLVVVQPGNATFSCQATGRPRPDISWFRQEGDIMGAEISNGVDILIEEQEIGEREIMSTLTIVGSVPMDADEYVCEAENIVTANTATATLTVNVIPEIQFPGEDFTYFVNESNPVNFSCSATGIPAPTIQWFRDDELLNGMNVNPGVEDLNSRIVLEEPEVMQYPLPDGDGNVFRTSRILTIYNTTGADNGTYTCEASNGVVRNDTQDFELFVQIPPLVVALPEDQMVIGNETEEVTLEFEIRNADPPVEQDGLRWFYFSLDEIDPDLDPFDGEEITNLMNRTTQSMLTFSDLINNTFVSLTVSNIVQGRADNGESDEGRYFLVASNPAGYSSSYIDLIIFGPPTIRVPPQDQFVINGNISVFQCESFAFPLHEIIWTFINSDGEANVIISTADTNDTTKYSIIREREPPRRFGILTISDVQYGDRGTYNCTARNIIGEESRAATLTVHVTPIVNDTSDLTEVNISLPATLVCLATGYPRPDITWQKNGEDFMAMGDARIDIFQFNTVSENASSGYESSGYMVSGGGIIEELVMRAGFTQEDVDGLGELGVVGVLTFEEVVRDDTASYTCTATNALPQTTTLQAESSPIPLVVLERPDPPQDITVVEFRARWVLLEWMVGFDGNRPIQRFLIYENNLNTSAGFTLAGDESLGEVQVPMEENTFRFNISMNIAPFSNYIFTVRACNELGCSNLVDGPTSDQIRTEEDVPDQPPQNVEAFSPSSTSIRVSWDPPPNESHNGIITGYRIDYTATLIPTTRCDNPEPMPPAGMATTTDTTFTLNNLAIYANYSIMVSASTRAGFGPSSQPPVRVPTLNDTSSAPINVMVDLVEMTKLTLSWSCPVTPNGMITQYMVYYQGMKDYVAEDFVSELLNATTMGDEQTITLTQLFPDTIYTISVSALSPAGEGERSMEVTERTLTAPPPSLEPPMVPGEQTGGPSTVTICFTRPTTTNGRISHYHAVAVRLSSPTDSLSHPDTDYSSFQSLQQNSYSDINCGSTPSGPQAYIAAEFADSLFGDGCFTFGDDERGDRDFTNGPLCFSSPYTFFLRAYTQAQSSNRKRAVGPRQIDRQYDLFSSTDYTPVQDTGAAPAGGGGAPAAGIAAGVVVGVVVVIAIIVAVIVIIIFLRRRRTFVYKTTTLEPDHDTTFISTDSVKLMEYRPPDEGSLSRQPIPLAAFATHIEQMHINENCGFGEEYKVIQDNSPKQTVEACIAPDNKPRNRYANIQCFDHSRVHLHPVEGFEHDYINANFIDGYNRRNEYIATQGPLPDTVGDFWRLILDYNVGTIVMLTNLVEKMKVKCTQYWPNTGSQQYSNITVTITNVVTHADFVMRIFEITAANSGETKQVRQYHFISWPDFGVPRHATPLLYFLRRIRSIHPPSSAQPIAMHCSAGVGRTGSLICIDVEIQRARQEGVVDPFNFTLHMRQARNHMVQTEAQYVFLHDAIQEAVTSGNTEVSVEKLAQRMSDLEDIDADGESGYQKEFDRLRQFRVNVREFTDANDDANKFKNRLANALPFNYNRVHLLMSPGVGGSDYINASYIDGYSRKQAYIATQGPLKNTIEDFWRMIWEKETHVIVMLTQLSEKGKVQCARYWPDSLNSPEKIGSLTIEVLSEDEFEDYVIREIKVTDVTSTVSNSRVVHQFQFRAWPEHGAPTSGAGMIDLIDQVTRKQQQTGNKSIVVHCSAGIGRTGSFCALSVAIERVKSEGMADVFHTVKHLRTQRPHMVQTVDQYIFCYRAIREYVDSLSSYSNFQFQ